ncbi:NAD(P)-dependent alcohol dehydrogenase [uncultured Aquimonas sp.]|uniref:NAD(P)-dependent alcohol dehydrogenase n=1 Tax=uncultured Aquimonas sp. TaxID=385483 RepID=UPI000868CD15|nr:NAD(P)-dependent alcohol dehydrogenase [uncultured Aquimonas sp.]ODU41515.1 MAG: hydroxyacid dehydrogenase [Xanthomonadaceae bacterium SCN 69-123]
MPHPTLSYAAPSAKAPLAPFKLDRREVGPTDVLIEIAYCGVCHSDLHQAREDWGPALFPMVPGHEIVGHVTAVGAGVLEYKVGDRVGVGCMVDSCRTCEQCAAGEEQFCDRGASMTYNGFEQDGKTMTFGGYSQRITVDQAFVVRVPEALPLDRAAPLLCAGITTYSPLKRFGCGPGKKVAVMGLGGLGHVGVRIARAMGAEVTVISTSERKRADAAELGAHDFLVSTDAKAMKAAAGRFDLILDTVSAVHDLNAGLNLLRTDGTLVLVGVPEEALPVQPFAIIGRRRRLAGSLIGGIAETQEMLDFCAQHGVLADIETVAMADINQAWERLLKNDVRYRFVIDMATLRAA